MMDRFMALVRWKAIQIDSKMDGCKDRWIDIQLNIWQAI